MNKLERGLPLCGRTGSWWWAAARADNYAGRGSSGEKAWQEEPLIAGWYIEGKPKRGRYFRPGSIIQKDSPLTESGWCCTTKCLKPMILLTGILTCVANRWSSPGDLECRNWKMIADYYWGHNETVNHNAHSFLFLLMVCNSRRTEARFILEAEVIFFVERFIRQLYIADSHNKMRIY
jgi:hypothetical protein